MKNKLVYSAALRILSAPTGAALLLLAMPVFASAIGGCTRSPEFPSALLGLLGAGAASLPMLKAKLMRSRKKSDE